MGNFLARSFFSVMNFTTPPSVYCELNMTAISQTVNNPSIYKIIGTEELQSRTHRAFLNSKLVKTQSKELNNIKFDKTDLNLYALQKNNSNTSYRRTGLFSMVTGTKTPELKIKNHMSNEKLMFMHATLIYNNGSKNGKTLKDLSIIQDRTGGIPRNIINFYKKNIKNDQLFSIKNVDIFGEKSSHFLVAILKIEDGNGGKDYFSIEKNPISTCPLHISLAKLEKDHKTPDSVWKDFETRLNTIKEQMNKDLKGHILKVKKDDADSLVDVHCSFQD